MKTTYLTPKGQTIIYFILTKTFSVILMQSDTHHAFCQI